MPGLSKAAAIRAASQHIGLSGTTVTGPRRFGDILGPRASCCYRDVQSARRVRNEHIATLALHMMGRGDAAVWVDSLLCTPLAVPVTVERLVDEAITLTSYSRNGGQSWAAPSTEGARRWPRPSRTDLCI